MSTRSVIGRKNPDGSIHAIYCHFDGYLDGVGKMLFNHYQDAAKVDALIALGDLSSLGEEIGEKHDFNWRGPNSDKDPRSKMCNVYGRDRGETGTEPDYYDGLKSFFAFAVSASNGYAYLFDGGEWWIFSPYIEGKPVDMQDKYRTSVWKFSSLKDAKEVQE